MQYRLLFIIKGLQILKQCVTTASKQTIHGAHNKKELPNVMLSANFKHKKYFFSIFMDFIKGILKYLSIPSLLKWYLGIEIRMNR